jgi:hypothetical protein
MPKAFLHLFGFSHFSGIKTYEYASADCWSRTLPPSVAPMRVQFCVQIGVSGNGVVVLFELWGTEAWLISSERKNDFLIAESDFYYHNNDKNHISITGLTI